METKVFPLPAVAEKLRAGFIEARLHYDKGPRIEENERLQLELGKSRANPIYVIYDPVTGMPLRKAAGRHSPERFLLFLRGPIN
jgi:hypothetical protein